MGKIKHERDFKGIRIPKEVWLSNEMTMQEKLFYVEIDSLDNEDGCTANNEYFSKFFGISKVRVSQVINSLVEKGFVISQIVEEKGNKRVLNISKWVLKESLGGSLRKVYEGHKEKFKHNNTINNTINNNKDIFDSLWKIRQEHSKKVGRSSGNKSKAFEKFKTICGKITIEEWIKKIEGYFAHKKSVNEYTQHMVTRLNQKGYEEEYEIIFNKSPKEIREEKEQAVQDIPTREERREYVQKNFIDKYGSDLRMEAVKYGEQKALKQGGYL